MQNTTSVKNNLETCQTTRQPDLCLESEKDVISPVITAITLLPPNSLLLTDSHNNSLKRLNTDTDKISGLLQLTSEPWDITALGPPTLHQVAVTLPNEQMIRVISAVTKLSKVRDIEVKRECRGIDSNGDNKLVVCYPEPPEIEVMDHCGSVLCTLNLIIQGKILFVYYLSVSEIYFTAQNIHKYKT